MSELEVITNHINGRISSLRHMLDLVVVVSKIPHNSIKKLGEELHAIVGLLQQFEKSVMRQNEQLQRLQEFERSSRNDLEALQHIKENIPMHMPRRKSPTTGNDPMTGQNGPAKLVQQENARKTSKNHIKEIEFITTSEFETIPQYMKGRMTYEQLNVAVRSINKALTGKYKILHQPVKTLSNNMRKLYQRFKEEETKDTKGHFFVVEADIREFAQLKMDKRFQGILGMLRHCQRLRELRGGGVTRYVMV